MSNWKLLSGVAAASIMTAAIVAPAEAQVTTSSVRGEVTNDAGAAVSGATVTITHAPSGTVSTATTNANGSFSARGLRVGGPYTVQVSGGDFAAVEALVEGYGVKVDQAIHAEVLERNKQFTSAPYSGFVNPVLVAEKNDAGEITAIKVTQPETFSGQMLKYSKNYSFLPEVN